MILDCLVKCSIYLANKVFKSKAQGKFYNIDFKVFFVGGTSETLTFSKYFIRGGNYQGVYPDCVTQKQNYLANGSVIGYLITKKIPVWDDQTPLSYKQILKQGWKGMTVTNTLAYHDTATITAVKSFTVQVPEVNVTLFAAVIYALSKIS